MNWAEEASECTAICAKGAYVCAECVDGCAKGESDCAEGMDVARLGGMKIGLPYWAAIAMRVSPKVAWWREGECLIRDYKPAPVALGCVPNCRLKRQAQANLTQEIK